VDFRVKRGHFFFRTFSKPDAKKKKKKKLEGCPPPKWQFCVKVRWCVKLINYSAVDLKCIIVEMSAIIRLQRLAPVAKISFRSASTAVQVPYHHDRKSSAPLIEHHRSAWPDVLQDKPSALVPLPKRTVPDSALRFKFVAHFNSGGAFFYTHLQTNPADFKVSMKVCIFHMFISMHDTSVLIVILYLFCIY
jgi:hypothetical protein